MPLEINGNLRARLKELLLEILPAAPIYNGSLLDRVLFYDQIEPLDRALPSSGSLFTTLDDAIGPAPFAAILMDALSDELKTLELDYDTEAEPAQLSDHLPDAAEVAEVADRILARFESLPWRYSFTFNLPAEVEDFFDKFVTVQPIGPSARLVKVTDEVRASFGLPNALGLSSVLFGNPPVSKWSLGKVVLQVDVPGYVNWSFGSNTAAQALTTLRSIVGLGIALGLFKAGSRYAEIQRPVAFVHLHIEVNATRFVTHYDLTHSETRAIGGVCLSHSIMLHNEAEQIPFATGRLEELDKIFQQNASSKNLKLAGKWFSDGTFGDDDLLNFVQTTMVLEILLGDKATSEQVGLGTLLSNRCAYLIGRSHSQRAKIIEDFSRIYDVRSQIVHRGKHRLAPSEMESFARLRFLASQVIRAEARLVFADLAQGLR